MNILSFTCFFNNILLIPHGFGNNNIDTKYTPYILEPYINSANTILVPERNDLFTNLDEIYKNCKEYPENSLFIGGDHSISISTINAIYKPKMKIVWIDAHPDINTEKSSMSNNYHGMPLSFLTGLEKSKYNINLPFEDILYIGIRDIDPYEKQIIETKKIKYIHSKAPSEVIEKTLKEFIGDNKVHISFDVDALDYHSFISSNTRVHNGLTILKAKFIFDILLKYDINSMDIVEINFMKSQTSNIFQDFDTIKFITNNYHIFR
jgi:arginase